MHKNERVLGNTKGVTVKKVYSTPLMAQPATSVVAGIPTILVMALAGAAVGGAAVAASKLIGDDDYLKRTLTLDPVMG